MRCAYIKLHKCRCSPTCMVGSLPKRTPQRGVACAVGSRPSVPAGSKGPAWVPMVMPRPAPRLAWLSAGTSVVAQSPPTGSHHLPRPRKTPTELISLMTSLPRHKLPPPMPRARMTPHPEKWSIVASGASRNALPCSFSELSLFQHRVASE